VQVFEKSKKIKTRALFFLKIKNLRKKIASSDLKNASP